MNTQEEKRKAVLTLIESSVLLSYTQKLDLIEQYPLLTQDQLDALGKFLATEEKIREDFGEDIEQGMERVLETIVGAPVSPPKTVYVGSSSQH